MFIHRQNFKTFSFPTIPFTSFVLEKQPFVRFFFYLPTPDSIWFLSWSCLPKRYNSIYIYKVIIFFKLKLQNLCNNQLLQINLSYDNELYCSLLCSHLTSSAQPSTDPLIFSRLEFSDAILLFPVRKKNKMIWSSNYTYRPSVCGRSYEGWQWCIFYITSFNMTLLKYIIEYQFNFFFSK